MKPKKRGMKLKLLQSAQINNVAIIRSQENYFGNLIK